MSSQADKERVREANDIVEVVAAYVALKQTGRYFKGLCPFHKEKTPSFIVSTDRQTFKCFGCGAGGDVFEFLMRMEGIPFIQALQQLAERGHVVLGNAGQEVDTETEQLKRQLYAVLAWAAGRFQSALQSPTAGKQAQEYLARRNVAPAMCERFKLGFAPAGWENLLRAGRRDHFSQEIMEKAGLLVARGEKTGKHDRFRGRLMFPIFDVQGRPVAFGGRLLGAGEPKYLNSPEMPVFHKGELLYGLNFARDLIRQKGSAVVTEGYMDVIACHAAGAAETVASLGTSLTPQQARLLKRYTTRVLLLYDMDEAGLQASLRAFEILHHHGLQVRVVTLPGAKDADEFIREKGASAFQSRLDAAYSIVEYATEAAFRRHTPDALEGKMGIIREVGPLILQFPKDGVEQGEYIHVLAERLRLLDRQVWAELERLQSATPRVKGDMDGSPPEKDGVTRVRQSPEEELIISTLLQFPLEIESFRGVLQPELCALAENGRLLKKILEVEPANPDEEDAWFPGFVQRLPQELVPLAKRLHSLQRGTQDPGRVLRDCLNRLQVIALQEQLMIIQLKIQEVERTGDMETLKQLEQEKILLAAQVRKFGVLWKSSG
ncbi:DNA primase [candidate division FCPU426 bacterium]|nr:DNA primase [candidate division FCPU426 bacterium]